MRKRLWICAVLLPGLHWGASLRATPDKLNAMNNTCLACHSFTPASGGLTFLQVNGAAASAPYGVTVKAGTAFTLVYRSTGLYTTTLNKNTGGLLSVPNVAQWSAGTGPLWTDNGQSAATPWTLASTGIFYHTNYPANESTINMVGLTTNNGQTSAPADKNRLVSDEVMSVTVNVGASVASAPYKITVAAMGHTINQAVAWSAPFYVIVQPPDTPTPSVTPSVSPTPSATRTATPSVTPSISRTFTVTQTPIGTFTATPTYSDSPTESPTFSSSPTFSDSPTQSMTATFSATMTATLSLSASPSPSATGTLTPTATISPSFTVSPTISPTWSPSPTLTLEPAFAFASPVDLAVAPNPVQGGRLTLLYKLLGDAENVRVCIYSVAFTRVHELGLGRQQRGGHQESVDLPANLALGAYFLRLEVREGRQAQASKTLRFYNLGR